MRPPCSGSLSSSGVDPSAADPSATVISTSSRPGAAQAHEVDDGGDADVALDHGHDEVKWRLTMASMPSVRKVSVFLGLLMRVMVRARPSDRASTKLADHDVVLVVASHGDQQVGAADTRRR